LGREQKSDVGGAALAEQAAPLVDIDGDGVEDRGDAGRAIHGSRSAVAVVPNWRVIVHDEGSTLTVSAPLQIARGLRNGAGMVFDQAGTLGVQDDGIDTEGNRSVSFSADELNRVPASQLGVSVPNVGFADAYVRSSDGQTIGLSADVSPPVAAFLPIDNRKSEGAVELACAPGSFPADFVSGLFVPFSGQFNRGGSDNDENPVVFVDPESGRRFQFISDGVMGHPNGVLATSTGSFLSDLNPTGRCGDPVDSGGTALLLNGVAADQAGRVYLITPVPEPSTSALALLVITTVGLSLRRWPLRKRAGCPCFACRRLPVCRVQARQEAVPWPARRTSASPRRPQRKRAGCPCFAYSQNISICRYSVTRRSRSPRSMLARRSRLKSSTVKLAVITP
jgi:hypothetical protein